MSTVMVKGNLLLNGNLYCDGDITVTTHGVVNPVPDPDLMKTYYSYQSNSYITANGLSRIITSTTGDIIVDGLIDGEGYGFESDRGPGCNSRLQDSSGNLLPGYGASHAGLGALIDGTDVTFPPPNPVYGNHETPVSLGSGGGYYHKPSDYLGWQTRGGGAIRLVADSGYTTINGTINMNGQDGTMAGGAAGGSVWVTAWKINGTGLIKVDGGNTLLTEKAGGGSGGYISLWHHRTIDFDGTMSVEGMGGAEDGKIFIKEIEPILEDPWTGTIWNTKWWDYSNAVTINNDLTLSSPDDDYNFPEVDSLFTVSGKEINIEIDYAPTGPDASQYNAALLLYEDDSNWVGIARRSAGFFGISSAGGVITRSGIDFDNTNITFRLLKNDSTFMYQYFDTTSMPQTIYTDVRPELANKVYTVKLIIDKLLPGENLQIDYLRLSTLDISQQYLSLYGAPVDQTAVAMNVVTGTTQHYGDDFYVEDEKVKWDNTDSNFLALAAWGDVVRCIYELEIPPNDSVSAIFDDIRIYDGIINGAETTEPVIYVDPDYGSDTSSGRQLDPLKNLFVATAWAKRGSTVVLYDGTHNPAKISRKNLTIRGAEGGISAITSQHVQDTTGSGWENNALSFYGCQGKVDNIHIINCRNGIVVDNGNYDISRNTIRDTSTAINFINCDPTIVRNNIFNTELGLDFTSCTVTPFIYANVISDASVALYASETRDMTVSCNTFDNNQTHVVLDNSSSGVMSSNNLTYSVVGIQGSLDSSFASYYNNFYASATVYNRTPDDATNNISLNPLYYDRLGKDFHINAGSPDIGAGQVSFNNYLYDNEGAIVYNADIGALQYIDSTHITSDYYVASRGDDHWNFGRESDPFRTLDRAMLDADSTIRIDGGHYDTFYLNLRSQDISISELYIVLGPEQYFISYLTLTAIDIAHKYVPLPTFVESGDASYVALNVLGSSAQTYGQDYIVEYGNLLWDSYALDGFLGEGDVLRVILYGHLQRRALNTLVLHGHYSNYDQERALFVSPSGSDSTVLGGDGTNTGGLGTRQLPYRTIDMALSQSSSGDNIVAMAGEYPIFNGLENRVIVPAIDRTSIPDSKRYYEDFFAPRDFRAYGTVEYDAVPWQFSYSGKSEVFSGGGFLNFTYDGTNTSEALSSFEFQGNFRISAELRNAVDPIKFMVTSPDNTVYFSYDESQYTAGYQFNSSTIVCNGTLLSGDATHVSRIITEYIAVTSDDTRNKYTELSYIPEGSNYTNLALNVIGGNTQDYGVDYYVEDSKIKWDGMTMDGEIEPGEVLRAIYVDRSLSFPVTASISLENGRITVRVFDMVWNTVLKRDMVGSYSGPWQVSFIMDTPDEDFSHESIYGKGFVSKFLAVADTFTNLNGMDKPSGMKTERRNLVFYRERV